MVDVDHGSPSDVICFDFVAQPLSLLQNASIMRVENLAIDINDPLKPYFKLKGSNVLGEAISGSVYCKAYNQLITDPEKQLFVPIIQWIDCASVTGNDHFLLKQYMFTPAIFEKKSEGVSRHGVIVDFCPRGSHHQLKSRHFAWLMPSKTITRSSIVYWSHFGNAHHNYVVFNCQLVPRVKYKSILSHVCLSTKGINT